MSWPLTRAAGPAGVLHARPFPDRVVRAVHVLDVERPALVLGSAQRDDVVDAAACRAAGVEVVRRRSGGGVVLLDPGATVWLDVELPRDDSLWDDDVGRAAWWLGDVLAAAVGVRGASVHRGPLRRGRWGHLVCFAGAGPGEVVAGEAKVAGISQRRTRAGARFQCAVPLRWQPERLAELLALDAATRAQLAADLAGAVVPVAGPADAVVAAVRQRLP